MSVFDGCQHNPPHEHGQNRTYRAHGCRCDECRAEHNKRGMRWRKSRALGSGATVDASAAREHVLMLRRAGLTLQDIADRAGITRRTLTTLMYGTPRLSLPPPTRIRRATADSVQAVQRPRTSRDVTPTRRMSAIGTARRLQALQACGWSLRAIAEETSVHVTTLHKVREDGRVAVATAAAVADVFERLWNVSPPSTTQHDRAAITYALNRARKNGWVRPAAWEEGTIDRADARPAC